MTILTRLPEDYHENTLAIRSSLQSVRFYVDGELRMEYDTSGTRLVGKNSASCYVFCPTSEDDAGKEVRIELTTNTAKYSGVVNTVYCGDEAAIWGYLFQTYGLETVIALFLLFAGIITIIFGIMYGLCRLPNWILTRNWFSTTCGSNVECRFSSQGTRTVTKK